MIRQTRFKTVVLGISLGLVEGLLKCFLKDFPLVETFGFQGAIVGGYLYAKTDGNTKRLRAEATEDCENGVTK
jgi:predicted ABC-type sugar transport system permease subunit